MLVDSLSTYCRQYRLAGMGFHHLDAMPKEFVTPRHSTAYGEMVTGRGLDIAGEDVGGQPVRLQFDEPAARALATALFITLRMKLAKAPRA